MRYAAYFKPKQKIILKNITPDHVTDRFEAFTVELLECGENYFDLALPYDLDEGDGLPFDTGTTFRLVTESYGLGMQVTGHFVAQLDRQTIRVKPDQDLEAFTRREYLRVEDSADIYCMRGNWSLRSARARWSGAVRAIAKDGGSSVKPRLVRTKVNLSAGGIRVPLAGQVRTGELALVIIDPADGLPPVCALSEVTWTEPAAAAEPLVTTGHHFINLLHADRERLDTFVRTRLKRQGYDVGDAKSQRELLDRIHF